MKKQELEAYARQAYDAARSCNIKENGKNIPTWDNAFSVTKARLQKMIKWILENPPEMSDMEMKVEPQPWMTPNYVLGKMPPRPRQEGILECPKWPLSEMDASILSRMCDEFRAEVFRKAGKDDPLK